MTALDDYLAQRRGAIDDRLDRIAPAEDEPPAVLHRAMRHSLFAGGKRIRPLLFWAAAEAVAGEAPGAEWPASSLELVHTYSLIHDDLPALDNDELRRGRPTCHKVFGEAIAILAGDALLTLAFRVLAETPGVAAERRLAMVQELAMAAGSVDGMIGGQVADLEAEGRPVEPSILDYIHRSKTGALIAAAVRMGGEYAGAARPEIEALGEYGRNVGLAFQIVDDILDVEGATEELGKTAGKDAAHGKATFPALYGVEQSRRQARERLAAATEALRPFGEQAARLRQIAERIVERSS